MKRERPDTPTYRSLEEYRDALKLSQRDAARLFGISQTLWSRMERRVRFPKRELLKRLVKKTGVPIEVLTGVDR